jgi:uncharacterized small protein (DUF1192 family)
MTDEPIDPEMALPWQKLGAALADLLRAELPAVANPDPHEARAQGMADLLTGAGVINPAELEARVAALAERLAGDKDRAHPKSRFSHARPNDIGGMPGGPVDPDPGEVEPWQALVIALSGVLGRHRICNIHERRRAVEDLGDDYHRLGYFERMVQSQFDLLCEKGVLTRAEIDRRIAALKERR